MNTTNQTSISIWSSFEVYCMIRKTPYDLYKREYILKNLKSGCLTNEQYDLIKTALGL